ncbi:Flp family type IVb pilin [Hyphomonas polymorpha]|nr:Flp family type IVb pilin [Hyphomonas polymorpha]
MRLFKTRMRQWAKDERGATAIEYGLIAGLMVLAIIGSLYSFAGANDDVYQIIEENLVGV